MALLETYVAMMKEIPSYIPKENRIFVMRNRGHDHLAPHEKLFKEFKARDIELQRSGLDSIAAHNQAYADVEFERRFVEQIMSDPAALIELKKLKERARNEDVYFICYEKPPKKCHRFLLLEIAQPL